MITREFVLAGKAILTVSSPDIHFTFKVRLKKKTEKYPDKYFISLLTGPENTNDYTYLGILEDDNVKLTKASQFQDDSRPVKAIRWAIKTIWTQSQPPQGFEIRHAGRCGRCGRLLTVPESIDSGIGPECIKKL